MMNKLWESRVHSSPLEIIPKMITGNDSIKCKHQ